MKRILAVLALMLAVSALVHSEVQAQALLLAKPFNGKINKAIASSIHSKLGRMGLQPGDPLYAYTLAGAEAAVGGAVVVGSVAATVAAIGSAPVWLSVALGLGALYEIYSFDMGAADFQVAPGATTVKLIPPGSVVTSPPPAPFFSPLGITAPLALPLDYQDPGLGVIAKLPNDMPLCATYTAYLYSGYSTAGVVCGADLQSLLDQAQIFYSNLLYKRTIQTETGTNPDGTTFTYVRSFTSNQLVSSENGTKINCTVSQLTCPQGVGYKHTRTYVSELYSPLNGGYSSTLNTYYTITAFTNPAYYDTARQYSLNDAAAKLQSENLAQHADPELLAALANKIWQNAAAQPGYEGAPYDVQNPVTAADVLADIAAGLYPHPTNADLLALTKANTQAAPVLDPVAEPVPDTAGETSVTVDLGSDPGIASPGLEDAPTGVSIVSHVMGLLPSLSNFSVPAHASTCEPPSFDFYGSTYTMQSMCDLLEGQRDVLSVLFSLTWGVISLGIVLRA